MNNRNQSNVLQLAVMLVSKKQNPLLCILFCFRQNLSLKALETQDSQNQISFSDVITVTLLVHIISEKKKKKRKALVPLFHYCSVALGSMHLNLDSSKSYI